MYSEESVKNLWRNRREELKLHVRKNIYGFFTTNAIWGIAMWGTLSFVREDSSFIKGFVAFLVVYFLMAYVIQKIYQNKDRNSLRLRYRLLMFWQDLSFLVLASSCFALFIGTLDLLQVTRFPYLEMSLILILVMSTSIWWAHREIKNKFDTESDKKRFEPFSITAGSAMIFISVIVASRLISSIELADGINLGIPVLFFLAAVFGIVIFFRAISYIYKDLVIMTQI